MLPFTNHNALQSAAEHFGAGRISEAEALCREILRRDPGNAGALHLLGSVAIAAGQGSVAVDLIQRAAILNPSSAEIRSALGNALQMAGRTAEAIDAHHRAIQMMPESADCHFNLGNACMVAGYLQPAITAFRRAVQLNPAFADAFNNLGNALKTAGQGEEALAVYRSAIAAMPLRAEFWSNLGNAMQECGHYREAVSAYQEALRLNPAYVEAVFNMGIAHEVCRLLDEAISCYRQSAEIAPGRAEFHNRLGSALVASGRCEEAVACYQEAIRLRPDFPEAFHNLGNALQRLDQLDPAISAYQEAIRQRPNFAEAWYNLGLAMAKKDLPDDAVAAYQAAIRLRPEYVDAIANLGGCYKVRGEMDLALSQCRLALALEPRASDIHSNLLMGLLLHPDYDSQTIQAENLRWNREHAEPVAGRIPGQIKDRSPNRRLRIGYISPDFREHVVGRNILPFLREHNRERFEIFCYANVKRPDAWTEHFRSLATSWRDISSIPDEAAAALVKSDGIDILVDLALHTWGNRLLLFARKPAPIQVTFAGYPGGTGLQSIDYRLTDPYLDPPHAADGDYCERTFRLPHSFWCYDPVAMGSKSALEIGPLPALKNAYVTFGNLGNFSKVNASTLQLWARVLNATKESRLLLLVPEGCSRVRVLNLFKDEGVAMERIEMIGHIPREQYLGLYSRMDIVLDTLPYNGHTTSLDALWMGVPVITLVGRTVVGRAGLSQLTNLGLPQLITHTPEDFVRTAVGLAEDSTTLAALRASLRERMLQSPLTDATAFARGIEAAYQEMWRNWCAR